MLDPVDRVEVSWAASPPLHGQGEREMGGIAVRKSPPWVQAGPCARERCFQSAHISGLGRLLAAQAAFEHSP